MLFVSGGSVRGPFLAVLGVVVFLTAVIHSHEGQPVREERTSIGIWADTVSKSPNKARPRILLGHAYVQAAEAQFKKALTLESDNDQERAVISVAIANMANLYIRDQNYTAAEEILNNLRKGNPSQPAAVWATLAVVYLNTGRLQWALQAINVAIAMDADDPRHRFNRAEILTFLGACDEAAADYAYVRKWEPSIPVRPC